MFEGVELELTAAVWTGTALFTGGSVIELRDVTEGGCSLTGVVTAATPTLRWVGLSSTETTPAEAPTMAIAGHARRISDACLRGKFTTKPFRSGCRL